MFLHGGVFHILFNMLALWMFGAELERIWGTRYFLKFYFVSRHRRAALTVLFSLLPFGFAQQLLARRRHRRVRRDLRPAARLRVYFPDRPIYMYFVFPIPAKYLRADHGRARVLLSVAAPEAASPTPPISAACWSATCSSRARGCIRWPS